jgi:predicted TIM-barrel fold metal-dependent hydrolase
MPEDTTVIDETERQSREGYALIDCDVHPLIGDVGGLRKHMSKRAVRRVFGEQVQVYARDPNRIPHPTSGLRLDARTPRGGPAGSDAAFALEQWIDPYDIAAALLIPIQSGLVIPWGDEAAGNEFISAFNNYFMEEWVGLDSRYRLCISVSPYDVKAAVAEVERLADEPGVAAIFVPHGAVALGRSHYDELYWVAERHGLSIVLHPTGAEGNLYDGPRLAGGLPDTYPERHSLLLQPGQSILTSMIFGGVFERFPNLKLVLSEYGASWALPMMWRMDRAWEMGDRELAGLSQAPSETIRRSVRFTTQPLDEPPAQKQLWDILDAMHAEEVLMFSSDYPHWDTDDPRVIMRSRLPEHLRKPIAQDVALACFGKRLGL